MAKKQFTTFFAWPDTHVPYHNESAIKVALKRLEEAKPDVFIILGDFVDNEPLMGRRNKRQIDFTDHELVMLNDQNKQARVLLDRIDKVLKKECEKVFIYGNHEWRAIEMIDSHEECEDIIHPDKMMQLTIRRYKTIPLNGYYKLGKLYFTHGTYHNIYHARKHLVMYQKSLVYGHMHTFDRETLASPMKEVPLEANCVGCLSDLNPGYKKNTPSAYDHGFCEGIVASTGSFWVYPRRIVRNRLVLMSGEV